MSTQPANALPFRQLTETCKVHGEYRSNRLRDDGVEEWIPNCPRCVAEAATKSLVVRAGIPMRFQDKTFENFNAETPGQQHALEIARIYAETFADAALRRGTCLTFVGNPGSGKTHLACAIAMHLQRHGHTATFLTVLEAIRKVRASWKSKTSDDEDVVLRQFSSIDLLVLDEVGVQYGTEAEQTTLFEIINRRYQDLRPTILISNLPPDSEDPQARTLRMYLGARAYDRLREGGGRIIPFDWQSYRGRA